LKNYYAILKNVFGRFATHRSEKKSEPLMSLDNFYKLGKVANILEIIGDED